MAASVTHAPVSREVTHASIVVTAWPGAAPPCPCSQASFGAAKYGSRGRPVIAVSCAPRSARRRVTVSARRSCQLSAGPHGAPVARSQRRTVSPWLPIATAATGWPASAMAARPAATTEPSSASGSASAAPPAPNITSTGAVPAPITAPPPSTTTAFVDDVPWSMARTLVTG